MEVNHVVAATVKFIYPNACLKHCFNKGNRSVSCVPYFYRESFWGAEKTGRESNWVKGKNKL